MNMRFMLREILVVFFFISLFVSLRFFVFGRAVVRGGAYGRFVERIYLGIYRVVYLGFFRDLNFIV